MLPHIGTTELLLIVLPTVLFFLLRFVLLWYWRINKIVALLEQIEQNTRSNRSIDLLDKVK